MPGEHAAVLDAPTAVPGARVPLWVSLDVALRLTALEVLLRPMGSPGVRALLLGLAAVCLLAPRLLRAPAIWLTLSALVAARIVEDWPLADNHIYLLGYWCLAAGLALGAADPSSTIARSARLLLGCTFALAVLWKAVLAPEFTDTRFFRVTLLTDPRFESTVLLTGMTPDDLAANRAALQPPPGGAELLDPPDLVEPPAFRRLASALTWGGLVLESALAIACLLPFGGTIAAMRHGLLLAFCATTYAVAPVAGFGWLILAMGVSLCGPADVWLRRAYVSMWLLVLLYSEVPWAGLLVDWVR